MVAPTRASGSSATPAWRREAAEVAEALGADPRTGLSDADAAGRLARFGPNELAAAKRSSTWRRLTAQFVDPLVLLLLAAVAVSLAAWWADGAGGIPYDAVVISAIVLLNGALGFAQEARAGRAVAALRRMTVANAVVLRDGREKSVPAPDVVPGDVMVLAEGDAVVADARLLNASSLMVAEAPLTGESEAVLKQHAPLPAAETPADRVNMVFKGTAVTRGHGRAVVTSTGMDTEMGEVARMLAGARRRPTPLQAEVARVGRMLGAVVVAVALVVVTAILLSTDLDDASETVDVLLIGVSLAVAAVPEGLPAVLSVVLAVGVQRMAARNAIVKGLSSVETLGSASVVCSDKTGTLTKNEMTIVKVVVPSGEVEVTGVGYRPEGEPRVDGRALDDPALKEEASAVIAGGCLVNDASLEERAGEWTVRGDPTEAAFLAAEAKFAGLTRAREDRFERVRELPFTPERRMMTTLQADIEHAGDVAAVTKGAPDALLERCVAERAGEQVRPLTGERRAEILADVERLAGESLRTLAVAFRPLPDATGLREESIERELVYLGMVGIIDPPRPEARQAVEEAQRAGVRVVMITGDHPHTAVRIARDLGIAGDGARVMTGADVDALDDHELVPAARETGVYARVAPAQKLRIVDALQADGAIVAMTGDGVNDAPALKSADIGVAMGSGTEVAKEAAHMVLADDDFATIIAAIREGRTIFSNIRKFLRFLLSSNAGEVLTMLLGVLLAGAIGLEAGGDSIAVPLLATQILWINLLTDATPALAMGFDPSSEDVMSRAPRRLGDRVIDAGMWAGIAWIGLVMAVVSLSALDLGLAGGFIGSTGDLESARTMAFTTLVIAQLFNCFNARSGRESAFRGLFANRLLWGAVALSAALQVAVVHLPFMNDAFDTVPLGARDWALCVALASVVLWAEELRKLLARARS